MCLKYIGVLSVLCEMYCFAIGLQCYKCRHLIYLPDKNEQFIESYFKDTVDSTCITANKDATDTQTCPVDNASASLKHQCGYVTGEVTAHLAQTGDFKLRVYIRECMQVVPKELSGCHSNSDVIEILSNSLAFVPGLQIKNFYGDLCLCGKNYCQIIGCAKHHFTIPYSGQYGKCVHIGILVALSFAMAGSMTVICAVCVCCCSSAPSKPRKTNKTIQNHKRANNRYSLDQNDSLRSVESLPHFNARTRYQPQH